MAISAQGAPSTATPALLYSPSSLQVQGHSRAENTSEMDECQSVLLTLSMSGDVEEDTASRESHQDDENNTEPEPAGLQSQPGGRFREELDHRVIQINQG